MQTAFAWIGGMAGTASIPSLGVQILPVEGNSAAFLDIPATVYETDPQWVAPLRKDVAKQFSPENPFYQYGRAQAFVAMQGDRPVGRVVAAVNDRLLEREERKVGVIGFFEAIDDLDIVRSLLDTAECWLRDQGMELARGPINFSTHNSCLFLTDEFDSQPHVMMPYNPAHYPEYFQQLGWSVAKSAYAYHLPLDKPLDDLYERGYKIACRSGITFRPLRRKKEEFLEDCRAFYELFTTAFANNWSSSARSEAEFIEEAKDLKDLVDDCIFWIAEDKGKMVGLFMGLPDYNIALKHVNGNLNIWGIAKFLWYRRKIDRLRILAIASLPEYRRKMVPLALIHLGMIGATTRRNPYKTAELSWVYEDNWPSRKVIEATGAKIYKTYAMFEKELG